MILSDLAYKWSDIISHVKTARLSTCYTQGSQPGGSFHWLLSIKTGRQERLVS